LAGSEYITSYADSIVGSRQRFDYVRDNFQYLNYGGLLDQSTGGSGSEWRLFSLFGSATYVFDTRYMITANLRADASSRFAANHQWGYFPSVSVGWRMSNERFMQNVGWISDLKLRASTGTLGNQEIDNYAFLTLLRRQGDQFLVSRYGNPDLKWETTSQKDLGVDVGVLNNKLYLSLEYFVKKTSDILLPISLPSIVGNVSPTIVNAGEVSNKGFEVALNFTDTRGPLKYGINLNAGTVTNRVDKLHPNLPNIIGDVYKTEVGHPLGAFYGYVMEGIYQNQNEINTHLFGTVNPPEQPGDIRFKDLNGDGKINDNDSSKKSSIFVEDASYFRLKNLEIGYALGPSRRVYVSAQNLFTITNYSGLDPESTDILDRGTYPQATAFLFGINATF